MLTVCCPVLLVILSHGCFTSRRPIPQPEEKEAYVRLEPRESLFDESVISAKMTARSYDRIMIVPPSGTAGAAFDRGLSNAERALMRRGIELISPAVGGRVVATARDESQDSQAGVALSDLERVLVLADGSGADAVLQIGEVQYDAPGDFTIDRRYSEGPGSRYLVYDEVTEAVREVDRQEYERSEVKNRWRYTAPIFIFTAKLVGVSDGTILASYQFRSEIANALHRPYTGTLDVRTREIHTTSYDWLDPEWADDARAAIISQVFDRIGRTLTAGNSADLSPR
jgi:hypothetical protein